MSFTPLNTKPTYFIHKNGHILGSRCRAEMFESALTYIPDDDDIFIVTYPKCGTTWAQCILHLMKNSGNPLGVSQNINDFVPHLEDDGADVVRKLSRPRIIKTHLPYHLIPKNKHAKYIYIARNPKDCCVSFFHHTKGFVRCYNFGDGTFDEYFELFLKGEVDSGDYFDHLVSWIEHKHDPNVLFLLYEDMKMNIVDCVGKIGDFLGGSFSQVIDDPTTFKNVLKYSSFDTMRKTPTMWASERAPQFAPFIRKGKVGDWRSHFSEEQSKRLQSKFQTKLSGTEAEFLWKDYDC